MVLDESIFSLDLESEKNKRIALIREFTETHQRSGVLIPLSGGIDSTTCLYLAIEAVGLENVIGWFAPYKHITKKETNKFVEDIKEYTGVNVVDDDSLIDILRAAKTPRFHDARVKAARRKYESEIKMYYQDENDIYEAPMNVHTGVILGCRDKIVAKAYSSIVAQHYAREFMAKTSDVRKNFALVCCANLTEWLIGWFTKGGLDDSGDVKPIADLYKTQVQALAAHIPILESVKNRDSTSDMGIGTDKDMGLPDYLIMDFVLKGYLELGMTPKQISDDAEIPIWTVVDVVLKYRRSEHMRHGAYTTEDIETLRSKTPTYFKCVDINETFSSLK